MGFQIMGTDHLKARCICTAQSGMEIRTAGCPIHDKPELVVPSQFDIIQKARHYNSHPSGVEAIDICRHLTGDWFNAFKYVFRSDHKNGRQDIEKALYYAKDAIAHDIPVRAPSWKNDERILLLRIIDTEPDDRRLGFFISILNADREGALSFIEDILESWPT
jgi:hypothetical protein